MLAAPCADGVLFYTQLLTQVLMIYLAALETKLIESE